MPIPITFNNTSYKIPVVGDLTWGSYTTQYLFALGTFAPSIAFKNLWTADQTFQGYIIVQNTGGLVLQSANGTNYSITVDNNGVLGTTPVTIS